nr:SpoIIE family protein phosphatase [Micromonospora sp. NBRC 107566]
MPAEVIRRIRLPADRRTPAAARAVVRTVLAEADLPGLLDEALLLTTELTTNGVVHAGTELDVEVVADGQGLTVTVMDFAAGPAGQLRLARTGAARSDSPTGAPKPPAAPAFGNMAAAAAAAAELSERGRGLLLVDHFASRWGTTHHAGGKGVWFRLDRQRQTAAEAVPVPEAGPTPSVGALTSLLQVAPEPQGEEPAADFAGRLLGRLAELIGAAGGVVRLDRADGAGPRILARYGRPPSPSTESLRVPLAVNRPYLGELELDSPPTAYARPLAGMVADRIALTIETDRLRRADLRRQGWLTFLAECSELLAQSLDVELTMALIPQLVVPRLGQWCAVHIADAWGELNLTAAAHADESALPQLYATLRESGPDSIAARLRQTARAGAQIPLPDGFAVPLVARGQRLGTLSVGRQAGPRHDVEEIAVLEDVARRAALAIDNARIHAERRRVAHTLQQSLLPPVLPVVKGIGLAAEYVPTGDDAEVGGDFYDVIPLPDNRWLVVVGDVSGKGVQAATVTGLVRDVIRVLVRDGRPLPDALARVNDTLVERGGGRFCTLAVAELGLAGDALDVNLHLAGHQQPVLVRADGRAGYVGAGGTALGLLDTVKTPSTAVPLRPGDSLIFYTDGVTERRRGRELFGLDRLRAAAAPLAGYSADVVAARLRATTLGFSTEPPRDDIAILVIRNDT